MLLDFSMNTSMKTNKNLLQAISLDRPKLKTIVKNSDQSLNESQKHLLSQMNIVKNLSQEACLINHFSKKSPTKLKTEKIAGVNPSIGNTVVEEYRNNTLSHKLHILALSKKIQLLGKKLGIIGESNCPMQPQVRLHSTISTLILDKPTFDEYNSSTSILKQNSNKINQILSSHQIKNLNLILDSWKILPDGNLGLQFNCDPKQSVQLSIDAFKEIIKQNGKTLTLEQKKTIYNNIMNCPNVYNSTNNTLTLTSLQAIRLNLALAGAEVKAFHPGTLMVIAWTKDANALKNHENVNTFFNKLDILVSRNVGIEHIPDAVKEFAYNERTLHPNTTVDNEKSGVEAENLNKKHLITGG